MVSSESTLASGVVSDHGLQQAPKGVVSWSPALRNNVIYIDFIPSMIHPKSRNLAPSTSYQAGIQTGLSAGSPRSIQFDLRHRGTEQHLRTQALEQLLLRFLAPYVATRHRHVRRAEGAVTERKRRGLVTPASPPYRDMVGCWTHWTHSQPVSTRADIPL